MPAAPLFTPIAIGALELPNRVVMASMTRGRAENAALVPTELHAQYYAQRASAGLILGEGTWPTADAVGYVNVPGLYSDEQADAWRKVTDAVHRSGGRMFAQLGHTGASSHPDLRGGELPAGPSAVNPGQKVFTPHGLTDTLTPRAMTRADIDRTVAGYGASAALAKRAGFDGVELHAHMTYLVPQFLNDQLNQRADEYGGSDENRARFLFEALDALIEVWGADRVGIKLAPGFTAFGGFHATSRTIPTYEHIVARLDDYPLAYLQLADMGMDVRGTPVESLAGTALLRHFRPRYRGRIMANGGMTLDRANAVLAEGLADLVSFATLYVSNPDLVERFRSGAPLAAPDRDTLYAGGASGYVDYPRAET